MEQTETLEIVTVEKASEKELVKVNPLKVELTELKKKYAEADTTEFTEKDHYLMWKDAVADFRTHKTKTEKKRKEHKSFFLDMGKIIDKNYNDVIEDAEAQQEAFNKKVKEYEAEKDRIKKEKEEAKQRVWLDRSAKLTALNALYADDHFILGDAIVKKDMVASLDDAVFAEVLKGFKEAHDKIEAEAKEQERLKQEAADKLRQEQEEFKRKQEEFEKQQREFAEKQAALQKQQEELDRQNRQRQEEAERKERWEKAEAERKERERLAEEKKLKDEAENNLWRGRLDQLNDIGWNGQYAFDRIDDETPVFTYEQLITISDDDFNYTRDIYNGIIAGRKVEAERKQKEEQERLRKEKELDDMVARRETQLATIGVPFPANLREMTDPEYASFYTAEFESFEKKKHEEWLENERVKKIQEEDRRKEELAAMTDGEKWRQWKLSLAKFALEMPSFSTKRYNKMQAIAFEKFSEIQSLKAEKISSN